MKNKEQLAKEFVKSKGIVDFELKVSYENMFKWGFSAKEDIIKESLQTLEQLRENINNLPQIEQILKSRDLDRINNKIEILQSLL